ncbi:unnamed protein product [Phaedon cochleariae]|uniref:Lipase n=1 Tax=Phaedon cochleariae TaxID=80249 RepID=A0A9P0GTW5_PHACE|nr:unnamed protein product [Phaedon cochleariae]
MMEYVFVLNYMTVISVCYGASIGGNNVCTNFQAYSNLQYDRKHCHYNPDVDSTPFQIAERYGYKLEDHQVETEDGYILTIFRVRKIGDNLENRQPALLQHGILVDGVSWMISGKDSLAFTLVANGIDLWVPNSRGTQFSSKHVNSSISEKDYWNFSFHELASKDLPAIIQYVSKSTKRKDLIYIGHSMGSTSVLVYSTLHGDHAKEHIKGIICLAPVAYLRSLQGIARLAVPFYPLIKEILEVLGLYALGQFTALQKFILSFTCSKFPLILPCQIINALSTGLAVEQVRPDILPLIMTNFPSGTSTKTLYHYSQIFLSGGNFQWYDYGSAKNEILYNSTKPPDYDIEKISVPVHIFSGKRDFLATHEDVKYLYSRLNCSKEFHVYDLAHNDYAYGKRVNKLYSDILDVMKNKFNTGYS